jgi:RNA polymerase sigma factor (sigma-70 family)
VNQAQFGNSSKAEIRNTLWYTLKEQYLPIGVFAMEKEDDLVLRAAGGDGSAYEELVLRHRSEMLGWAHSWACDWDLSEDLYQEAVLKGYIHIDKLKDSAKFKPWMRKIIRNEFLMHLRRARRERTSYITLADEEPVETNADPSDMVLESLLRERTRELLDCLSNKESAVFEAHILSGSTIEETAFSLNLQKGAVYTYLSRARSKLTEALFRLEVRQYLDRHTGSGSEKQLRSVHLHWFNRTYNSMVAITPLTEEFPRSVGIYPVSASD